MKLISNSLCLVLIAALCFGCGGSTDQSGETKKKGIIGYSAMSLTNPFFKIIADSITSEGNLNGFDVVVNDANSDGKLQAEHIDSYIVQGAQAIILNPCDRLSVGPAIQKANKAGIPVFTCDLQCVAEGVKITGHIGTDNFQGGQLAGKAMIEVLERCFPEKMASGWDKRLKKMIPSYGESLKNDAELLGRIRSEVLSTLKIGE